VGVLSPIIHGAYILVGSAMMVYGIIWQPKASLTAAATIALGAAVYHFWFAGQPERS